MAGKKGRLPGGGDIRPTQVSIAPKLGWSCPLSEWTLASGVRASVFPLHGAHWAQDHPASSCQVLLPVPIHHPQSRLQAFAQEAPPPPLAQPLKLSSSPHTPGISPGGRSWLRAVRTPVLGAGRLQQVRAVPRVFKTGVGSRRGTAGAHVAC